MIGNLYLIRNSVNTKVYIGKTYDTIEARFKSHIRDSKRFIDRPLYKAINKYGHEKFSIEHLGSYQEGDLEAAEIEEIAKFDSYNNGYNATLGGDGKRYLQVSDDEIIEIYKSYSNLNQTAATLNIHAKTVKTVLLANSIPIVKTQVLLRRKPVRLLEIEEQFDSAEECAKFLIDSEISNASLTRTIIGIQRVCQGIRKSYKGLKFEYYPCDPNG